jgi:hypothetical protein
MLSDVEEEGRGGIPKRYRHSFYSTRRTKTRRVPRSKLMNSLLGEGVVTINLLSYY